MISKKLNKKLFVMQKQFIRSMFNLKYNAHTDPSFQNNRILKLDEIIRLSMCKNIHKVINYMLPSCITNLYTIVNTPTSKTVRVKLHKSKLYNSSYLNTGVMEWQKTPQKSQKHHKFTLFCKQTEGSIVKMRPFIFHSHTCTGCCVK